MALIPGYHGSGKMGRRRALVLEAVEGAGEFGLSASEIKEKSGIADPLLSYALFQLHRKRKVRFEWQKAGKGSRYAIIATLDGWRLERGEDGALVKVPNTVPSGKAKKQAEAAAKPETIRAKTVVERAMELMAEDPSLSKADAVRRAVKC